MQTMSEQLLFVGEDWMATMPEGKAPDRRSAEELPLTELLAEDFRTHGRDPLSPGFWAVAAHRLGSRAERAPRKGVRPPLRLSHKVLATAVDWIWGIHIPVRTRLGRRVHIWHFGSMLLNARSIGNDVHLRHATTFGPLRAVNADRLEALPVIEDAADIGSGACVMGAVVVGRDAKVGANTVVVESVPPGSTVFGVPARVIVT